MLVPTQLQFNLTLQDDDRLLQKAGAVDEGVHKESTRGPSRGSRLRAPRFVPTFCSQFYWFKMVW